MSSIPSKVTVSAGGVVLNSSGHVLVVSQDSNSWSLPKGHIDPGEQPQDAAIREIQEEAGITEVQLLKPLGAYARYKIGKTSGEDQGEWKVMIFFLFKTSQMELNPQDPRHPEARWVLVHEVESLLSHPKDKEFYRSIRGVLK